MASASVEAWVMRPVIVGLNNMFRSVPPEPPKEKTTFGMTHYTCLPSKSKPAEYECKKGFDASLEDQRHHPNPVMQLLVEEERGVYRHKYVDEVTAPDDKRVPYFACYYTNTVRTECVKGQFKNPFEEGRVKYVSVPTLVPKQAHEWYIQQRWPRTRIVEEYTPMVSDLNKPDSKP